jgi:tetratricopeptide (TPR) repeat protein
LPIAAILGVALALRLAHWAAVRRAPFVGAPAMDSWEYDRWAREIAGGDWLGHGRGVFFQAPLYPYLLALLYKAVGTRLDAAYLAQIGLALAGCYALYRAGRAMAGELAGLAAAALAAVYGPFLFYDVQLLKESLAVTAVCFLLWAMAWARGAGEEAATGGSRATAGSRVATAAGPEGPPAAVGAHRGAAGAGRWFLVGLLLGVLALLRENALLVVPFLVPLAWMSGRRGAGAGPGRRAAAAGHTAVAGSDATAGRAGRAAAFLAGVALALAPVALRNGLVGGDFLPTTSQGGVNFFIGNNPRADGTYRPIVPGKEIPELERREPARIAEQALGRPLTAAGVSRYWLHRALAWARSHPGDFLRLTLRKLGLFWNWYEWPDAVDYYYLRGLSPVYRLSLLEFGGVTLLAALGLGFLGGGRARGLAPALVFAGAWMVSTVAFFLFARYRLPAVPALLLLAALPVAALVEAVQAWRAESRRQAVRAAGLGLAVAAAFVLPRLAGFEPRLDLVHYNLGRLAEERGDPALAGRHYQAALAAEPGSFLAWLDLGNLAARRRDWPEALRCYLRAAALEPDSDDAQSNLGGIYLALGDLPASSRHLERALALNPRSFQALQNSALLRLRLGDLAAARELNRRALAIDPANPAARRLQARLAPPAAR